ncbi:beta-1-4-N-acetylgalactosaminyltransferase bre-4 [Brachionus plicatilis]|uniref:Beta-1,4-galactosyltransferase n=1 Tax=Brachionus plicatilis TaxID=10195 RepID=A0A3M7R631_BRAPC|nr:beta-1-4-N-acetylgalactosaminyltransferase bre-4 [Brachionus plicatilis]
MMSKAIISRRHMYNLFEDALQSQNVTNFEIRCQNSSAKNLTKADFIQLLLEDKQLTKKLSLIKHGTFKFCNLTFLRKQFRTKSVYFLNKFKFLTSSFKSSINNFKEVQPGGYFNQSLFCIHEYLYFIYLKTGLLPNNETEVPLYNSKLIEKFKKDQNLMTFIIIPYLNRESNLKDFLFNMHKFFQNQHLNSYQIVVAEQNVDDPEKRLMFNKGRLYNAAYKYILSKYSKSRIKCLIFHDVDLLPESEFNFYECDHWGDAPRHLSFFIRSENSENQKGREEYEKNPYEMLVGGVLLIKPHVFELINGFSNRYWNWGGEDDANNVCIKRPRNEYAIYKMSGHKKSVLNPERGKILFTSVIKMKEDGLSNLDLLNVTLIAKYEYPLFTKILVNVSWPSLMPSDVNE